MNREGQVISLQRESVMVKNRRQERMCPPIHKLTNESRTCVLVPGGTWEPMDTIEKHQVRAGLLLCHRLLQTSFAFPYKCHHESYFKEDDVEAYRGEIIAPMSLSQKTRSSRL